MSKPVIKDLWWEIVDAKTDRLPLRTPQSYAVKRKCIKCDWVSDYTTAPPPVCCPKCGS